MPYAESARRTIAKTNWKALMMDMQIDISRIWFLVFALLADILTLDRCCVEEKGVGGLASDEMRVNDVLSRK